MRFSLYSLALRNLKRKSFRTLILMSAIGLLVSIIVFGSSFLVGVSSTLKKAKGRLGADLLVVPSGARESAEEVLLETKSNTFYMDKSIIERLSQIEGIDALTYQIYLTSIIGICCDIPAVKIVAFNQDTDFIVKPWLEKALGRRLSPDEAIIGYEAYRNYDLLDVESSTFFGKRFKLSGVLEKTGTGLDNAIFINEEAISDIIAKGKAGIKQGDISLVFVKLKSGYDPYKVGRDIEGKIVAVDVIERTDIGKKILSVLSDINNIFLLTISLASVLSVFLTWTVFTAIVNERSKEVGIMRAMGAKGRHITQMFFLEVFLLGLFGSLTGALFGTYLSLSLSKIFTLLRDVSGSLTVIQRIELGILGIVIGIGICIIGAFSSILRIRRLEPLSTIKEA